MRYLEYYVDKKGDGEVKWAIFVGYTEMKEWNEIWDFFVAAKSTKYLKDVIL